MAESEKSPSGSFNNSGCDEESVTEDNLTKVCFICMESGDPVINKLKTVTANVLSKSVFAISERNKLGGCRKSMDLSKVNLPPNLQKQYKYHQSCFRELTNLSGKKRRC